MSKINYVLLFFFYDFSDFETCDFFKINVHFENVASKSGIFKLKKGVLFFYFSLGVWSMWSYD